MGRLVSLAAALLLLLAGEAYARESEVSSSPPRSTLGEVEARLAAEDPGVAAWGAYLAGRDGHREAAAAIRELLRRHRQPFDPEWNLVHRAALDALIRLDEEVDDGLLGLQERRFPVQVLVLRARRPQRHLEALQSLLARSLASDTLGLHGIAVGNLLVGERVRGLAVVLLPRVRMRLTLRVRTPAPHGFGGRGGSRDLGIGHGDALAKVPPGFPPYVHYSLWRAGGPGREILARGPRTVWSRRVERAEGGIIGSETSSGIEVGTCGLEWIAALLERSVEDLGVARKRTRAHDWEGVDAYVAFAREAREAMLGPWWDAAAGLVRADLLSRDEVRALEPPLTVVVEDERTDRSHALPVLPPPERPRFARRP